MNVGAIVNTHAICGESYLQALLTKRSQHCIYFVYGIDL